MVSNDVGHLLFVSGVRKVTEQTLGQWALRAVTNEPSELAAMGEAHSTCSLGLSASAPRAVQAILPRQCEKTLENEEDEDELNYNSKTKAETKTA